MGEKNLGEMNLLWAKKVEEISIAAPGSGPMTLMKAIINDYWADANGPKAWPAWKVDEVMSKIYWCWVAWLDCTHIDVGEEE